MQPLSSYAMQAPLWGFNVELHKLSLALFPHLHSFILSFSILLTLSTLTPPLAKAYCLLIRIMKSNNILPLEMETCKTCLWELEDVIWLGREPLEWKSIPTGQFPCSFKMVHTNRGWYAHLIRSFPILKVPMCLSVKSTFLSSNFPAHLRLWKLLFLFYTLRAY